ncbi:MAG: hypothetical protein A2Y76_03860 [Planctomycetes bacterium RBG_13_60_9]|nr:MAG: hypothetical protein A2Y76_03860 [Planctomycetes bacterium RBG_13_60_9]
MKPWDGNSGDDLIWLGTEYLLDSLHLSRTLDPRAADVILIPGGNQTMWWPNIDVWKEVWSRWPDKDFVVGPTTIYLGITNWDQDVRQSHARVRAIFARDPESYAILQTCGFDGDITTGLSHDPAVFLRDSELIRAHKEAATNDFVLATFRDDWEGTRPLRERLGRWADLVPSCVQRRMDRHRRKKSRESKIAHVARRTRCTRPLRTCDVSNYPFPYFLEMVRSAAEVHTDRLHCMLLAVMLGKPTFAYPTTYRKLEAVYEHSVKDWAHVEFVRDTLNLPAFVSTAHRVVRIV